MALTHVRLLELLSYDPATGAFTRKVDRYRFLAGSVAGAADLSGYICIKIDGVTHKAHRLAIFYMTGKWPVDEVDHRDRNKANNAWANLREATHAENMQNQRRRSDNNSGRLGVYFHKRDNKWYAQIRLDGKANHLGSFATIEAAGAAYDKAKADLHPFAQAGMVPA